jgi:hypothetical protein
MRGNNVIKEYEEICGLYGENVGRYHIYRTN